MNVLQYKDNLKTEWEANALEKNIIVYHNLNTKNNDKNIIKNNDNSYEGGTVAIIGISI